MRPRLGAAARLAAALALTVLLVVLAARYVDVGALAARFAAAPPASWLPGAALTVLTMSLRGLRLGVLTGRADARLLLVSWVHNAATSLLPAKLGELALPLLLRRVHGASYARGFGALVLARLFDLLVLGVMGGACVALHFRERNPALAHLAWLGVAGSAAALAILTLAAGRLGAALQRRWPAATGKASSLAHLAELLGDLRPARALQLAGLSAAIWTSLLASLLCYARALAPALPALDGFAAGSLASLAFALPAAGIANLGPFEGAWVLALAGSMTTDLALATALAAHGGVVAVTTLLGALGLPALLLARRDG